MVLFKRRRLSLRSIPPAIALRFLPELLISVEPRCVAVSTATESLGELGDVEVAPP